jgi:hypothetical protein
MKKRWMVIAFVLTLMACRKDKPEEVIPEEKIKTCSEFLSNYRCVRSDSLHVEGIVDGQKIVLSHCSALMLRKFRQIAVSFSGLICQDSFDLLHIGTDSGLGDKEVLIEKVGDTVYLGQTYPITSPISSNRWANFLVWFSNLKFLKTKDYNSHPSKTNFITITKVNKDTSYVEGSFAIDIKRDSLPNFVLTEGRFRLKECLEK